MDLRGEASTSSQTDQPEINPKMERPIFLSYSGKDKAFVKRLYKALRNAGHDPFLDTESLPPGESFPPSLIRALKGCQLGVVVLSPDFLTSKWPMRELHILHTSPSSPKILPLFYKLHPDDLKHSSPKFPQWQAAWQKIAQLEDPYLASFSPLQSAEDPSLAIFGQLQSAVVKLAKIQGVVQSYDEDTMDEDDYIERVVLHVSSIIRPLLSYDISNLTGHERLTEEVDKKFRTKPVIGFHGIGGLGKTTICKLMVNKYASIYAGRCALIEFPTNDCNEEKVVSQCRKALNQLTSTSKTTIDRLEHFDQCVELMKQRVSSLDVFIALDNIWEACLGLAQRILDVGFSSNSKILVTSRSSQVLSNLLQGRRHVMPLPSLTLEEARQIFVKCFNRNQSMSDHAQLQDAEVDDVIQPYRFNGTHHPLGIIALGASLGRIAGDYQSWFAAWKQYSHALSAANCIDDVVDKAIKISFDSIPTKRRNIFLDVALIYIPHIQGCDLNGFSEVLKQRSLLHEWLSALHQEMNVFEIRKIMNQLAYDGLLEFEESGVVHVHDLHRDLAIREARASGKFLLLDHTSSDEGDEYVRCGVAKLSACKEPGRILLQLTLGDRRTQIEAVRDCSMQMFVGIHLLFSWYDLYASGVQMCALEAVHSLRVLKLSFRPYWNNFLISLRHMRELSWLEMSCGEVHKRFLRDDIAKLSKLCFLSLMDLWIERGDDESCEHQLDDHDSLYRSILCLDGLVHLQVMVVEAIPELEEISGLGSLMNLECMVLRDLPKLRKVGDFSSSCSRLQDVQFHGCKCLTQVEGLAVLPNLQTLTCGIPAQRQIEVMVSESVVQELNVHGIMKVRPSMRMDVKVEIQGLSNLKTLCIMDNGDTGRLYIDGSESLRELVVKEMVKLEEMSACGSLRNLECLTLRELPSLTKVSGIISRCSVLRTLHCEMHILELLIDQTSDDISSLQEVIVIVRPAHVWPSRRSDSDHISFRMASLDHRISLPSFKLCAFSRPPRPSLLSLNYLRRKCLPNLRTLYIEDPIPTPR